MKGPEGHTVDQSNKEYWCIIKRLSGACILYPRSYIGGAITELGSQISSEIKRIQKQ